MQGAYEISEYRIAQLDGKQILKRAPDSENCLKKKKKTIQMRIRHLTGENVFFEIAVYFEPIWTCEISDTNGAA